MEYSIKIDLTDISSLTYLVREAFETGVKLGMSKTDGINALDIQNKNLTLVQLTDKVQPTVQKIAEKAFEAGKQIAEQDL